MRRWPLPRLDRLSNIGHCCVVTVLRTFGPELRGNPVTMPELPPQL